MTTPKEMFIIYLPMICVLVTFLMVDLYDKLTMPSKHRKRWPPQRAVIFIGATLLALAIAAIQPVMMTTMLLTLVVGLGMDERHSLPKRFVYLTMTLGLVILIAIEFIHIADFLDNSPAERFNTVFKFGEQVWLIFAASMAVAIWQIWQRLFGRQMAAEAPTHARIATVATLQLMISAQRLRAILLVGFAAILIIVTIYPVEAVMVRGQQRTAPFTYGEPVSDPDIPPLKELNSCAAQHNLAGPLALFGRTVTAGQLEVAYQNPDVTIYQVPATG